MKKDIFKVLLKIEEKSNTAFANRAAIELNPITNGYNNSIFLSLLQVVLNNLNKGLNPLDALAIVKIAWCLRGILEEIGANEKWNHSTSCNVG